MSLDFYDIADVEDGFGATNGRRRPHRGLDIPRPGGTPIPAWRAGTVVISEYHAGLGWVVETDSGGVFPGYCHMIRKGLPVGTVVELGDTIGYVGTTGTESGGNHLHTTAGNRRGAVFGESMAYLEDPWPLIQAAQSKPAYAEEAEEHMNRPIAIQCGNDLLLYDLPTGEEQELNSADHVKLVRIAEASGALLLERSVVRVDTAWYRSVRAQNAERRARLASVRQGK